MHYVRYFMSLHNERYNAHCSCSLLKVIYGSNLVVPTSLGLKILHVIVGGTFLSILVLVQGESGSNMFLIKLGNDRS